MVLRSRVSSIARQPLAVTEDSAEAVTEATTPDTAEAVLEAITEDAGSSAPAVIGRGGIRQPAVEVEVPSAETEVAQAPLGESAAKTQERKRPGRKPRPEKTTAKVAEAVTPIDQMAAPQVRAELKDLEAKIKEAHARHKAEIEELRSTYRSLHDRLFDLTK